MFVSVHEVSWETPGMMSKRILRATMRTTWMVHAPNGENIKSETVPKDQGGVVLKTYSHTLCINPVGVEIW